MGWFPARDKDGNVPPENLNFPQPAPRESGNAHRQMQWRSSSRQENKGDGGKNKSIYALLARQAMLKGYLDGKQLERKKR